MHDKTYEMQPFKTSNLNNFMNYKNEIIICEIIFIKFAFYELETIQFHILAFKTLNDIRAYE